MSKRQSQATAYHEAAHAVAAPTDSPAHQPGPPSAYTLTTASALALNTPAPGELPLVNGLPPFPPEIAATLSARDRLLVVELVRGATWGQALDAAGVPPKARIRDTTPPARIDQAAQWTIEAICQRAAVSRSWILGQLVTLYRRACQAEPVIIRGEKTGEYKMDGTTAKNCLELMGLEVGMFGKRAPGLQVSDVAALLRAVADRGRPPLPGDGAKVINQAAPALEPAQSAAGG